MLVGLTALLVGWAEQPAAAQDVGGVRAYFDMLVEAGGRTGRDAGGMLVLGGGIGVQWGGFPREGTEARNWYAIAARGRGGSDPNGSAVSLVDLRVILRRATEAQSISLEVGPTVVPWPERGGGGGAAVVLGSGGASGFGVRLDATAYQLNRFGSGPIAAIFSVGVIFGVAGYRD